MLLFWVASLIATLGSCVRDREAESADGHVSFAPQAIAEVDATALAMIRRSEGYLTQAIHQSICALAPSPEAGTAFLHAPDGILVQLGAGVVPKTFSFLPQGKTGVELVYWIDPERRRVQSHVFGVTSAALSAGSGPSSQSGLVGSSVGLVYGCANDPSRYEGYFGTLSAGGVAHSWGLDALAGFSSIFRRYLAERDRLGSDDARPENFPATYAKIQALLERIQLALDAGLSFAGVGKRAFDRGRFVIPTGQGKDAVRQSLATWGEAARKILGRGLSPVPGRPGSKRLLLDLVDDSAVLSRTAGEGNDVYELRRGSALLAFAQAEGLWEGDRSPGFDPESPDEGWVQLLGYVGLVPMAFNIESSRVFMNQETQSVQGPGLGILDVGSPQELKQIMNGTGPASCRAQRAEHPDVRWFAAKVQGSTLWMDCYGYAPGEEVDASEGLLLTESSMRDWIAVASRWVTVISSAYELLFQIRLARMQIFEALRRDRDLESVMMGGIDLAPVQNSCNALTIDLSLIPSAVRSSGVAALRLARGSIGADPMMFVSAGLGLGGDLVRSIRSRGVGVDLAMYRPFTKGASRDLDEALPVGRILGALRDLSCLDNALDGVTTDP